VNKDQIKESSVGLFEQFNLPSPILNALTLNNFINPTPIQQEVLPVALKGLDVLGSAQTGTGKTLAFVIPLLARLIEKQQDCALIIVPTRELAAQVQQALQVLISRDLRIVTVLLIGGEPIFRQYRQLRMNSRIVVGTPGRIIDHLGQGTYNPKNVSFLVLDEMDRMFDMGFDLQVAEIIRHLSDNRQTMMFSATLPKEIEARAQKYLKSPVRISVGLVSAPAANITQEIIQVQEHGKYQSLVEQLNQKEGSIVVFVKTKMGAARLAERLSEDNHSAVAMHGDLGQNQRANVVRKYRQGLFRILVATDIAARGLDIPRITVVINYDLPECAADYIHRIGRTARAGAQGIAVCLIAPHERRLWSAIDRLLNPDKHTGKELDGANFGSERGSRYRSGGSSANRQYGNRGNSGFKRDYRSSSFGERKKSNSSMMNGGFSRSYSKGDSVMNNASFKRRDSFARSFDEKPRFFEDLTIDKPDGITNKGADVFANNRQDDYKKSYNDKRNGNRFSSGLGRKDHSLHNQPAHNNAGNKNHAKVSFFDQKDSFKKRNSFRRDVDRF